MGRTNRRVGRPAKRSNRRSVMVGFRLTKAELRQIEAHCRKDELLSECVRRLLLERTALPIPAEASDG